MLQARKWVWILFLIPLWNLLGRAQITGVRSPLNLSPSRARSRISSASTSDAFLAEQCSPSSCIYPQDGREKWNRPPSPLTVWRNLHPEVPRPVLFLQYTPSGKGCSSPGPCPAPSLHPPGLRKTLEVEVGSLARLGRTQKTGE